MIDEKKLIESFRTSENTGRESFSVDAIVEIIECQAEVNNWIPCSERLPDTDESGYAYVLVCMDDEFVATTDYLKRDGFSLWEDSGEVIAWQPLPEPYREEEREN